MSYGKRSGNRSAGKAADVERSIGNESLAKRKATPFDSRVGIRIVSYRSKLADPDNISGKAAIDGLVHCGILRNDSSKEVASYRADEQYKVDNAEDERTVIAITEID